MSDAKVPTLEESLGELVKLVRIGNKLAEQGIQETRAVQKRLNEHEELTSLLREALGSIQRAVTDVAEVKRTVKQHGSKLKKLTARVKRLEDARGAA